MIRRILEKIGPGWIFLIIAVLVYAVVGSLRMDIFLLSVSAFQKLLLKILPVLAVVFGIIFLSNLFIEPKKISKHLGEEAGIRGWLIAIAGGIISTGPIYLWYPLLSDLKEKGMRDTFIAVFLYNRAVKIPLIPMMTYYFGVRFTVVLTIYMVIFSVLNGFFVEKLLFRNREGE